MSNKLKAGVITFHRAINYGAVLQMYGLQKKLENMNIESCVIDYRCKYMEDKYASKHRLNVKNHVKNVPLILKKRSYTKKKVLFREFVEKYCKQSQMCCNSDELKNVENQLDFIITGSDQVWNNTLTNSDNTFFLDFVKESKKKVSYAASFGLSQIRPEFKKEYKEMLKSFGSISVRENTAQELVKTLGVESKVVVDPVFLLSKDEWAKLVVKNKYKKPYILIYSFKGDKYLVGQAKILAKKFNCEIICISETMKRKFGIKYIDNASPEEFVSLIHNANFVLTNSFHGTVFSIVFNKPFVVELFENAKGRNSRIENLLFNLKLEDRIYSKNMSIDKLSDINYKDVEKILNKQIIESERFLENTLKNCED